MARKSGAIIKSRNKKVVDENPLETVCPICKHKQVVTDANTEVVFNTKTYWCEKCGEQYLIGMAVFDYVYS